MTWCYTSKKLKLYQKAVKIETRFSKVTVHKIDTKKDSFLHAKDELTDREMKNKINLLLHVVCEFNIMHLFLSSTKEIAYEKEWLLWN